MPLRQLGVEAAGGRPAGADWGARLRLTRDLLGRRFDDEEGVVVKANVPVAAILSALTSGRPHVRSITLYFPLNSYLAAILRSLNHRRWGDRVTAEMAGGIGPGSVGLDRLSDDLRAVRLLVETRQARPLTG